MWRRELIRLVLAANWIVFGISCSMVVRGHNTAWRYASQQLAIGEVEDREGKPLDPYRKDIDWDAIERRKEVLGERTEPLRKSGEWGWGFVCLTSLGTAVLLMVAFPKRTE